MGRPKLNVKARLISFIEIKDDNECWNWKGGVGTGGYRNFHIDGKNIHAHQAALLIFKDEKPPKGKEILHLYHNKLCCNPLHLKIGTHSENIKDSINAGRKRNPKQKLKYQDYVEILSSEDTAFNLSKIYGVSENHIKRIKNGQQLIPTFVCKDVNST